MRGLIDIWMEKKSYYEIISVTRRGVVLIYR